MPYLYIYLCICALSIEDMPYFPMNCSQLEIPLDNIHMFSYNQFLTSAILGQWVQIDYLFCCRASVLLPLAPVQEVMMSSVSLSIQRTLSLPLFCLHMLLVEILHQFLVTLSGLKTALCFAFMLFYALPFRGLIFMGGSKN